MISLFGFLLDSIMLNCWYLDRAMRLRGGGGVIAKYFGVGG